MLKDGMTTAKVLEMNIGCLVHLGLAIPFVHHFMSSLRDLHVTAKRGCRVKINGEHQKDLVLMLDFLKIACKGISLNSIAFQRPIHIYRSDSCPAILGGYSNKGWAWRWYLPDQLLFRASNNLLEHLNFHPDVAARSATTTWQYSQRESATARRRRCAPPATTPPGDEDEDDEKATTTISIPHPQAALRTLGL
jgi:hypothetical protein